MPDVSEHQTNDQQSTSTQNMVPKPAKPSDLVFENENLKLYVEKAAHLQEKKFRLQDHMYHVTCGIG